MEQLHYISTLSLYKKNNAGWRLSLRIIKYCVRKTPLIGGKGNDDLNVNASGNHTYIVNGDRGDDTCHMRKMSGSILIVNMV
ncbi:MAG: hypothetical protein Q9N32_04825 [Gammaproteobacteria bacterium]|nr:hypothetical protein [Gammaproteobacteria bacterium]